MARNPELFKAIDKEINDAYGELRKYTLSEYNADGASSIGVYVCDYIYRIIEHRLSSEVRNAKVGKKLTHDSNKIKVIVKELIAYALTKKLISKDDLVLQMNNYSRFDENVIEINLDPGNRKLKGMIKKR